MKLKVNNTLEEQRIKALLSSGFLDVDNQVELDNFCCIAAHLTACKVAAVTLITKEHTVCKAKFGDFPELLRKYDSFCFFTVQKNKFIEFENLKESSEEVVQKIAQKHPELNYYAAVPLQLQSGEVIGTLCVLDTVGKKLTTQQIDMLYRLAENTRLAFTNSVNLKKQAENINTLKEETITRMKLVDEMCLVSETDLRGEITYVNDKHCEVSKYSREELVGANQNIIRHPDTNPTLFKHMWSTIAKGDIFRSTIKNQAKDGTPYYVDAVIAPVMGEHGKPVRYIGVRYDKTSIEQEKQHYKSYLAALNHSHIICELSFDGSIVYANDLFVNKYGGTIEELIGKEILSVISNENIENDFNWEKFLKKGELFSGTFAMQQSSTEKLFFQGVFSPIKNELDQLEGVLFVGQDITALYKQEAINKINLDRLRLSQQLANIGNWEIDIETQEVFLSEQVYEMLGISTKKSKSEAFKQFKSMLGHYLVAFDKNNEELLTSGVSYSMEFSASIQGEKHYFIATGDVKQDENDNPITLYGSIQDITYRKKIEFEYALREKWIRSLVGALDDEVFVLDQDLRFKDYFVNDNTSRKQLPQEIVGKKLEEANFDEEAYYQISTIAQKAIEERNNQNLVYKLEEDGQTRWFELKITYFAPSLKTCDLICVSSDVTERKNTEDQIKQFSEELFAQKVQAEAASKAKSSFLSNMSHEIRTPLNGVIGFTELLEKTQLNANQKSYVSTLKESSNILLGIVNDILDFSKIEADKLELDEASVDLLEVIHNVTEVVSYAARKKQLQLLIDFPPELVNTTIIADSVRIKQVLINLLNNAVKFTNEGTVELGVKEVNKTDTEITLKFYVYDTGKGIEPNKLRTIFDAFAQEDSSTTRKFGGTGLGLPISNKLIQLMGGDQLVVDSEVDKGSSFSFILSFKKENAISRDIPNYTGKALIFSAGEKEVSFLNRDLAFLGLEVQRFKDLSTLPTVQLEEGVNYWIFIDELVTTKKGVIDYVNYVAAAEVNINTVLLLSSFETSEYLDRLQQEEKTTTFSKPITQKLLLNYFKQNEESEQSVSSSSEDRVFELPLKILIVDDNRINLFLATKLIGELFPKASIIKAYDGQEAVDQYDSQLPDLIFMDIQMPVMDGHEATKKIRSSKQGKEVKIIALTANNTLEEKDLCLKSEMDDYLSKPIVIEELKKKLVSLFS